MNEKTKGTPQTELTQRQRQILKLLQAGKVNKEVARELDIGLGTVKQHIVALFKKLNVRNRAMAVSRGMDIRHEQESHGPTLTVEGVMERRPCVVLSLALPEEASQRAVRLMYGSLADIASSNNAIFLTRQGNAGEIIFGIQRVTEYDVAIALQTACAVYDDMLALDAGMAEKMRGCLTAGLAVASMKRFGGWTGEVIASAVISSARELLDDTPLGRFAFDSAAVDLVEVFGIGGQQKISPQLFFHELKNLHWTGLRRAYSLVGRAAELGKLDAALIDAAKGEGRLIYVEGEMGMGKSRLCEEISRHCLRQGGAVELFRCLPEALGKGLYDTRREKSGCCVEEVVAVFNAKPVSSPELVIVDDFHLLNGVLQAQLTTAATDAVKNGKMIILSGRRWARVSSDYPAETINLRRLPAKAVESMVRGAMGKGAAKASLSEVREISSMAAGVPLFAVELARHHETERLALPLLVAINARLDHLHLDRNLLRAVAKNSVAATLENIAEILGEDTGSLRPNAERAVAAGVLSWDATGGVSFTHPLLLRAIDSSVVE